MILKFEKIGSDFSFLNFSNFENGDLECLNLEDSLPDTRHHQHQRDFFFMAKFCDLEFLKNKEFKNDMPMKIENGQPMMIATAELRGGSDYMLDISASRSSWVTGKNLK